MSTTATSVKTQDTTMSKKLRNGAIAVLFAVVLLVPKLIHIRRSPKAWKAFRVLLGIVGAATVVLPLGLWDNWIASVLGLVVFLVAALMPGAKPDTSLDEKARELGAFVVINGGHYQPGNAAAADAKLFVGPEHVWALDGHLRPLLVMPVAEMLSARADEMDGAWILKIRWSEHNAEFIYRGIFAEHLARVAENTLTTVMKPALPILPQRRAASA